LLHDTTVFDVQPIADQIVQGCQPDVDETGMTHRRIIYTDRGRELLRPGTVDGEMQTLGVQFSGLVPPFDSTLIEFRFEYDTQTHDANHYGFVMRSVPQDRIEGLRAQEGMTDVCAGFEFFGITRQPMMPVLDSHGYLITDAEGVPVEQSCQCYLPRNTFEGLTLSGSVSLLSLMMLTHRIVRSKLNETPTKTRQQRRYEDVDSPDVISSELATVEWGMDESGQ
jgi:hypothetical protein